MRQTRLFGAGLASFTHRAVQTWFKLWFKSGWAKPVNPVFVGKTGKNSYQPII
jgi:hypothetical protein